MKILKNKKIFALLVGLLVLLILFFLLSQNKITKKELTNQEKAVKIVQEADKYFENATAESYDVAKADELYHQAHKLDTNNERAFYQLVRVYYVQGEFNDANSYGDEFIKKFPNNGRIHYILGLNNAYARNLDRAEKEFKEFINSKEVGEAGYLDLAWVYFKKGEYQKAKETLEAGIQRFGDNAWLNLSLAMNKFNLGEDKKEVLALLEKAKTQAEKIDEKIWKRNYSSNDPKSYKDDINKFRKIIDLNIKLVNGEDIFADVVGLDKGLQIETLSPKGLKGGYTVSACCSAQKGQKCNGPDNACGMHITNGQIDCSGKCSILKKADKSYCTEIQFWTEKVDLWDQKKEVCKNIIWGEWKKIPGQEKEKRIGNGEMLIKDYRLHNVAQKQKTITGKEKPSNISNATSKIHTELPIKNLGEKRDKNLKSNSNAIVFYTTLECQIEEERPTNCISDHNFKPSSDNVCKEVRFEQHDNCWNKRWVNGDKVGCTCGDNCDDPTDPSDDDPTDLDDIINTEIPIVLPEHPVQEEISIESGWSLDNIHWNSFDKIALLKTSNIKIYVRAQPRGACWSSGSWGDIFTFNINNTKVNGVDKRNKWLGIENIVSLEGVSTSIILKPNSHAQEGIVFSQPIKSSFCDGAGISNNELKVKIVNIIQQEI